MEHLTYKEIIGYVNIDSVDPETAELASRVSKHIIECAECADKLRHAMALCDTLNIIAEPGNISRFDLCFEVPRELVAAEVRSLSLGMERKA